MVLRRQVGVFLAALLGAVALLLLASSARGQAPVEGVIDKDLSGAPYAAGELIVTYKEDASEKEVEEVEREGDVEEEIPEIDAQVLEFPELENERAQRVREQDLERKKKELEKDPAVESVDYNYVYTGSYTPRDPKFRFQWGLKKAGFEKAWHRTRGNGVRVAVVDSGADIGHVDLRRKVAVKYDFVNRNSTVEDLHGHGTHVSGIVAARTGNGKGIAGGCPNCKLIIAKALDKNLVGYNDNISDAIIYSAKNGARVINLSLGSHQGSAVLKNAINYATNRGALVVAAGGNYGTRKAVYPAAYRNVVAVIHTDRYDRRGFDASSGGYLDVAAPGVDIISTVPGGYAYKNGSSMAAPNVSALAGLVSAQARTPKIVRRRILLTAQDLGPRGRDLYYGHGRIRADRAVR